LGFGGLAAAEFRFTWSLLRFGMSQSERRRRRRRKGARERDRSWEDWEGWVVRRRCCVPRNTLSLWRP